MLHSSYHMKLYEAVVETLVLVSLFASFILYWTQFAKTRVCFLLQHNPMTRKVFICNGSKIAMLKQLFTCEIANIFTCFAGLHALQEI